MSEYLVRQLDILPPEQTITPITIIGAGAIGSFVALSLAKMGFDDITVYDFDKIESYIKHDRDEELTYGGLQQLVDKYLIKDRKTDVVYETPQFMYMLIAMTLFAKGGDMKDRLRKIKK